MELQCVLLFVLILVYKNTAMKCEIGFTCACSEDYEVINCIDTGIKNMSLMQFNERHFERVRIMNLQKNHIDSIDWDLLNKFKILELVNLKDQENDLCFVSIEYNHTDTMILNDCENDKTNENGNENVVDDTVVTKLATINLIYKTILYKIIGFTTTIKTSNGYFNAPLTVTKPKVITKPVYTTVKPNVGNKQLTTKIKNMTTTAKLPHSTRKKFPLPARQNSANSTTVSSTIVDTTTETISTTPELEMDKDMLTAVIVSFSILLIVVCVAIWYLLQVICKFRCCRCGLHFCICFKKKPEYGYTPANLPVPIDNISFDSLELFSIPVVSNRRRKDS